MPPKPANNKLYSGFFGHLKKLKSHNLKQIFVKTQANLTKTQQFAN